MQTGRKFRIYLTGEQAAILSQWIGCQRVIRNAKIEESSYLYWLQSHDFFNAKSDEERAYEAWLWEREWLNRGRRGRKGTLDQSYAQFKTDLNPWLREVPYQILRNGVYRAMQAFHLFFDGVAEHPVARGRQVTESVLLTRELFEFRGKELWIGTQKHPVGKIRMRATREFGIPSTITIVRDGEHAWFCSFSFEDGLEVPTNEDLLIQHSFVPEARLLALDRGVAHPVADSRDAFYDPSPKKQKRILHLEAQVIKGQQKLAKQKRGSKRRAKTKARIAKLRRKQANLAKDWRNKVSHSITTSDFDVFVLEDLRLKNMTAAPAPREQTPTGEYPPNGAAAKAGLNKALLRLGLGALADIIAKQARRRGKAILKTPPHHSSQECALCGHTEADNRPTQAEFHCRACGHQDHADFNASVIHRKRGHNLLKLCRPGNLGDIKRTTGRRKQVSLVKPPLLPLAA